MAGGGEGVSLEYTPTWVVAVVCTVIVAISFIAERILHLSGKYLLKKNQGSLFQALQKIKEELMLLGFISLLLTVLQNAIAKICIPKHFYDHWLPCNKHTAKTAVSHFSFPVGRRLLAAASDSAGYCDAKGKAPLLSLKALHDLHIFIFVLAVSHVVFSALTILFGGLKIQQWKKWEDSIEKKPLEDRNEALQHNITHVQDHAFVRSRFSGIRRFTLFSWLRSFFKQFYGSVNKSDYKTLRLGFIMKHCRGNPNFNFYKYMIRAFEKDFKKVVGISWYLWIFVVIFLLLNVYGWHAYFWISFVPLTLLLAVGTKLEHVITQLAREVAEKHTVVPGELVVRPSDNHFWFNSPRLVLVLIHIILFQNAFEIAVFFWMLVMFGFDSCIMGEVGFIIPRLVIGVFVQILCSYSTLPLYAIVAQMGSMFSREIFDDHIQSGLVGWAEKARNKGLKKKAATAAVASSGGSNSSHQGSPAPAAATTVEMMEMEQGKIHPYA
ncbi:MLO-like protein 1 [Andrographis paniculata]|uniref:MLO-like protein 1 n=1 Tax=Andrographis paniculata TaxID=175694 RepID=UPI0021E7A375|nr:MLO-like protein 1 [Andrographis paniculata]